MNSFFILVVTGFLLGMNALSVPVASIQKFRPTSSTIEGIIGDRISLSIPTDLLFTSPAECFSECNREMCTIVAKCADRGLESRINIYWANVNSDAGAVTICVDNLHCEGSPELFRDIPILFFAVKILQHHQHNITPSKTIPVTQETDLIGYEHHFYPCSSDSIMSSIVEGSSPTFGAFNFECVSIVLHADHIGEELIEWIAEDNNVQNRPVLTWVSRSLIHKFNLLHRGIGAILVNQPQPLLPTELPIYATSGEQARSDAPMVYVHKRAATKRLFPSNLDMFIGGVSKAGEPAGETLLRELNEECGLDLVVTGNALDGSESDGRNEDSTSITYLGETTVKTNCNHCIVDCFQVSLSDRRSSEIAFRDGEIEWGQWVSFSELQEMIAQSSAFSSGESETRPFPFVPDGMQVWDALPKLLKTSRKR